MASYTYTSCNGVPTVTPDRHGGVALGASLSEAALGALAVSPPAYAIPQGWLTPPRPTPPRPGFIHRVTGWLSVALIAFAAYLAAGGTSLDPTLTVTTIIATVSDAFSDVSADVSDATATVTEAHTQMKSLIDGSLLRDAFTTQS